ncbi:hypothetical protein GN244_ATG08227 [Phytophthora infestans]|uniref:Uncharacterized protein n=1 Tax=Phytophthora infestans TaxID=4787 RepID=A0A833SVK5_PHYIN|nr:hypothetical protein GN244_ATG08227 [Phytophthora infestans]
MLLIETAQEILNDADVQRWVLCTIIGMRKSELRNAQGVGGPQSFVAISEDTRCSVYSRAGSVVSWVGWLQYCAHPDRCRPQALRTCLSGVCIQLTLFVAFVTYAKACVILLIAITGSTSPFMTC